jgi:putative aldouronate transport system permease protein
MFSFQKKSMGDKITNVLIYTFLTLLCFSILYPFIQQFNISISNATAVKRISFHLLPPIGEASLDSYSRVLSKPDIYIAYLWTIMRTVAGTLITLLLTFMFAYPLSKKYCPFRNAITGMILFTMYFGGGLIPSYLLVRSLGMMNTMWALLIPGAMDAFTVVIVRNFMMSLPEELDESARIDGANEVVIFWRIILPLCKPILATVALWQIVGHWNSWFDVTIYLNQNQNRFLQVFLRSVMLDATTLQGGMANEIELAKAQTSGSITPESVKAAILMCATVPILFIYPFIQKYFVQGIMIGSLKG